MVMVVEIETRAGAVVRAGKRETVGVDLGLHSTDGEHRVEH